MKRDHGRFTVIIIIIIITMMIAIIQIIILIIIVVLVLNRNNNNNDTCISKEDRVELLTSLSGWACTDVIILRWDVGGGEGMG